VEEEVAATGDVAANVEAEDDKATTVDFDEADELPAMDFGEVDEPPASHEHAALLASFKTAPRSASKRVRPSSRR
jgi:hypothetical protein